MKLPHVDYEDYNTDSVNHRWEWVPLDDDENAEGWADWHDHPDFVPFYDDPEFTGFSSGYYNLVSVSGSRVKQRRSIQLMATLIFHRIECPKQTYSEGGCWARWHGFRQEWCHALGKW